jgi:hypothetical protein
MDEWDLSNCMHDPPPTKTIGQSVLAVVITLAFGAGSVSLFMIHWVVSEVGALIWVAATMGPAFTAAYYVGKDMTGYHTWARIAVGVITFFSVAIVIMASLDVHHF